MQIRTGIASPVHSYMQI